MSGKRNVILIVDDMEINRAILRGVLEDEYHILEAENGEQAMLLVEQYRSAIAVMLLDVVMPVKNGYDERPGLPGPDPRGDGYGGGLR